jgi:hypothetical protein
MPGGDKRRAYIWAFFFYLALVYITLPVLPPVVVWIKSVFGPGSLLYFTGALTAVVAGGTLYYLLRRLSPGEFLRKFLPLYLAAALTFLLLWNNPVEQVHILEYGILGYLGYRASGYTEGSKNRVSLYLWLGIILAAGLVDEIIQHFLPNRVFDPRDVAINALCASLGAITAYRLDSIRCGRSPGEKPTKQTI